MTVYDSFASWINSFLACIGELVTTLTCKVVCEEANFRWSIYQTLVTNHTESSSCLGRCAKPKHVPYVEEQLPKGVRSQGQVVEKHSVSDDFWGTSTGDLDYPVGQSQRSVSSLSTSNVSFHSDIGSANTNSHDFVNHGLLLWTQLRLQWIGVTKPDEDHHTLGPAISLNATYNSLLSSRERFRRPIPLSEMVEFLVDVWEQEGLYD